MRGLEMISPKGSAYFGSAYLWGTVTGLVIAIPLTGAVFGAVALATPSVAPVATNSVQTVNPQAMLQSLSINRMTKTAALTIKKRSAPVVINPAAEGSAGVSTSAKAAPVKADAVKADALPAPIVPKARTMRALKGCLSSIGVTKANIATEELTVCVADASIINRIN